MSVQTQLDRLAAAKTEFRQLLELRGVTVADTDTLDSYPALFSPLVQDRGAYLYTGTFLLDGWEKTDTGYKQSAELEACPGAPDTGPVGIMASGLFIEDGLSRSVDEADYGQMLRGLELLNRNQKSIALRMIGTPQGDGRLEGYSLWCEIEGDELPTTDLTVYLLLQ